MLKRYISRRGNRGLCELAKEEGGKEVFVDKKADIWYFELR